MQVFEKSRPGLLKLPVVASVVPCSEHCQVSRREIAGDAAVSAAIDRIPPVVPGILIGSSGLWRTRRDCDARYDRRQITKRY